MCFTDPELRWENLPELFPGFDNPLRWLPLLAAHVGLLHEAASRVRVTSVEDSRMVQRNYAESLEHWRIALEGVGTPTLAVDIGPGGGFPGLVAAIVSPDIQFHLVEPLQKRARLLESVKEHLGLANVVVHAVRAEQAARGPLRDAADIVTARAVAELRELIEYAAPFARTGGILALAKGSAVRVEIEAAANATSELCCRALAPLPMRPIISGHISVALFEKSAPTPPRYPRRPGVPGKRPL